MSRTILVTGATGYIGSHTCLALLEAGYTVVGIDNLSNSKEESLRRVQQITGKPLSFIQCDLLDKAGLDQVFDEHEPGAVIHFAGLKAVGESVEQPLLYYKNNLTGTINLLQAMVEAQVKNIVFSSSCTVYGAPEKLPIREDFPLEAVNPFQLLVHRLRRTGKTPHPRRFPAGSGKPVRPNQAHHRIHTPGSVRRRPPMEHFHPALLQPGRRPPQRRHRRRPHGHPQQPDALHHPGSRG